MITLNFKPMKKLLFLTVIILTAGVLAAQTPNKPVIKKCVYYGKSKPIREMDVVLPGEHLEKQRVIRNFHSSRKDASGDMDQKSKAPKPNLQRFQGPLNCRGPLLNFDGIDNVNGGNPADPNGDVSESYYMQSVNSSFAVWDKSGNLLYGPVDLKSLWAALPGPWHSMYWYDPIFKYDDLAGRWIVTSVAASYGFDNSYYMVAVSETDDPLGAYYCYGIHYDNELIDYPKLSVWPNGYYVTYVLYSASGDFLKTMAMVIDRDAMLAGEEELAVIEFEMTTLDIDIFFPLPADFHGPDTINDLPCCIVTLDDHNPDDPWDLSLDVYEFDPDWDDPANSTFETAAQFELGEFEPVTFLSPGAPQPINQHTVMTLPHMMMTPLTYRLFEDHESMVCNVTTRDSSIYYIKWFELRKEDSAWSVYQQGNYSPDSSHRYQPGISINANGDIAMGYTVSDEETFPSIRMTGRRAGDSLGVMTFQEIELFAGLNYINTYDYTLGQNRWGDYAPMMVDPADDTTFWFTNMYPKAETNLGNWGTRIFKINLTEEFENVTAFAGNDTMICPSDYVFITQGEATNYNAIQWTSSGDGEFLIDNIPHAQYIRGNQDVADGQVQLIMQAFGYEPDSTATDTMTLIIDPCTGIEEMSSDKINLAITPNPTNGIVTVRAKTGVNKDIVLQVINLKGELIFTETARSTSAEYQRRLDFTYKENGIYYIRLQANGQVATGKMVVVR